MEPIEGFYGCVAIAQLRSEKPYNPEGFKAYCWKVISEAVEGGEKQTQIDTNMLFLDPIDRADRYASTGFEGNKVMEKVYNELKDHFWNAHGVALSFGGNNAGTGVFIFRLDDAIMKNRALKGNDRWLYITTYDIQQQLDLMVQPLEKVAYKELVTFSGVDLKYLIHEISSQLKGGKIIKVDGEWFIQKDGA